jgi:predicted DCC family thiol-disulfide oxidoreductase YuxK
MNYTKPGIVLFDGVCNLCNHLVIFIIQRDPNARFRFAALQSMEGQKLLKETKLLPANANSVVYIRNGKYLFRSSAILHILLDLGGVWKLFYAFIILPPFIRNFVYMIIASTRYKIFGKRDVCMVPTSEIKERFYNYNLLFLFNHTGKYTKP